MEQQTQENPRQAEAARIRRMLRDLVRIAEHASLTGSLQAGIKSAVRQFNAALTRLEALEAVPPGLFSALDEGETNFDELGVAASQAAAYLEDEGDRGRDRMRDRNRDRGRRQDWPDLSGLHQQLEDLPDLAGIIRDSMPSREDLPNIGEIIRESMPDWMRGRQGPRAHQHFGAGQGAEAAGSRTQRQTGDEAELERLAAEMERNNGQIGQLQEQMRAAMEAGAADRAEEIGGLADQIARLAREQVDLGRRCAAIDERLSTGRSRERGYPPPGQSL